VNDERRDHFDDVYQRHYGRVLAYVLRRLPPEAADDVVAETFTTTWRHIDHVPSGDGELPWLYRVAASAVATQRRARQRHDHLAAKLVFEAGAHDDTTDDPAEAVARHDAVLAALRLLSPRDQEALLLTSWEDLDIASAAIVADCSPAAFKVRLHRARRRFAHLIALRPPDTSQPSHASTTHRTISEVTR
jgi:RNA polymerase sigma-70 factor (ECF subfamily)